MLSQLKRSTNTDKMRQTHNINIVFARFLKRFIIIYIEIIESVMRVHYLCINQDEQDELVRRKENASDDPPCASCPKTSMASRET
jgi:trehalose-6-phosphatase